MLHVSTSVLRVNAIPMGYNIETRPMKLSSIWQVNGWAKPHLAKPQIITVSINYG